MCFLENIILIKDAYSAGILSKMQYKGSVLVFFFKQISIVHKIKISMPHPFIQFCINMSLSVFENDHFTPHGGDIVQVNNQPRAERTSKLTFTNVKLLLKLIVTILEQCIMKIKTLTPKLTMIVCDIME